MHDDTTGYSKCDQAQICGQAMAFFVATGSWWISVLVRRNWMYSSTLAPFEVWNQNLVNHTSSVNTSANYGKNTKRPREIYFPNPYFSNLIVFPLNSGGGHFSASL